MFDSLDDQMKMDERRESSQMERLLRWAAVVVVFVLLVGGIYYGVRMLD